MCRNGQYRLRSKQIEMLLNPFLTQWDQALNLCNITIEIKFAITRYETD